MKSLTIAINYGRISIDHVDFHSNNNYRTQINLDFIIFNYSGVHFRNSE